MNTIKIYKSLGTGMLTGLILKGYGTFIGHQPYIPGSEATVTTYAWAMTEASVVAGISVAIISYFMYGE